MQLVQTVQTHSMELPPTLLPQLQHQLWKEAWTVQEQEEALHCSLHPHTEEAQTTNLIPTPNNGLLTDNPIPLIDTQQCYAHLLTDEQLYCEIDALAVLEPPYANPTYLDILCGELTDCECLGNFYNPTPELCDAYDNNIYINAEYCDPNYWLDI